jgi:hypothetical protein
MPKTILPLAFVYLSSRVDTTSVAMSLVVEPLAVVLAVASYFLSETLLFAHVPFSIVQVVVVMHFYREGT